MNNLDIALKLAHLSKQKDDLEKEIKALKAQLIEAYPMITSGFSPEYFQVSLADRVVINQQHQAAGYFLSHPHHRVLFKLSCTKEDFVKMGCPEFASIEKNAPTIKVDAKLLKTALAAVAEDMAA